MHTNEINIGIVTFPLGQAGRTPLLNLVNLFSRLAHRVYVVSGGAAVENPKFDANVQVMEVIHRVSSTMVMRIINYMHTELKILCHVLAVSRKVDVFVFFIGGESLFISLLALNLLGKRVLLMPGGVATKGYFVRKDPLSIPMLMLTRIGFRFVNRIVVYSYALAQEANLARYEHKLIIAHEHFVDFAKFMIIKKIHKRLNVVGYVGRLSKEKGILNLIEAIPLTLKKREGIYFRICGEGNLADEIEKTIKAKGLEAHVKLTEWIPHEDIPQYLNELKLLVLPSFTEGLPNILLEAIACGVPVLTTPVGTIPNIIKEGETGFLLKSTDSRDIAERIVELLGKPELLEKVSISAYRDVRENFSYKKTLEAWQKIFSELSLL